MCTFERFAATSETYDNFTLCFAQHVMASTLAICFLCHWYICIVPDLPYTKMATMCGNFTAKSVNWYKHSVCILQEICRHTIISGLKDPLITCAACLKCISRPSVLFLSQRTVVKRWTILRVRNGGARCSRGGLDVAGRGGLAPSLHSSIGHKAWTTTTPSVLVTWSSV